jgi:hypothetical protein
LELKALEQTWIDSLVDDPFRRHEEGGWIRRLQRLRIVTAIAA